uniref:Uncharacterized LOC113128995 n=1 Tax=Mastacembelus armatus TaxID=205130 RepID=A0A3Q3SED0_9TELE
MFCVYLVSSVLFLHDEELEHYMELSEIELNKLELKSLTDVGEESLAQDITGSSQLDFTHEDSGTNETQVHSSQMFGEDDGLARSNATQLTVSSLNDSQGNFHEVEQQPEDEDEELEMTLRSRGSSFVELYPSMISRIERAWHRQNVSEAADSVLRRYRRWRQQSNGGNLNNTYVVRLRQTKSKQNKINTSKRPVTENANSPEKRQLLTPEPALWSPLRMVTNCQGWEAQQQSPGRERGSQGRGQYQPILTMDLSGTSEASNPKESSLNETFTVSELPQPREKPSTSTVSPSRHCYTPVSPNWSLRSKRASAQLEQAAGCSTYASETTAVKRIPDIYSSPVRESPLKARMITALSKAVHTFSRSPQKNSVESFSREPTRPRSMFTTLLSPLQKPTGAMRMLYPQDSRHTLQPQLFSPQPAAAGHFRLRRHRSFDLSKPLSHTVNSTKKLDEELKKLYHKFVCQNKSPLFNGPPCRLCASSSGDSRGHSSSALAALALSPQRSMLRKRHRELGYVSQSQSKRARAEYCTSSPGSHRHGREMLRRCLSPSELEQSHDDLFYSSSKRSMYEKFSQRQAGAHQEAWMSQDRPKPAADLWGLGKPPP